MKIGGGDLPVPRVDPQNPDVVYSTSIVTCKSTDGGKTWISLRGAPGGDDYQNLWINPRDPKHPAARQRPGRGGQREWRRNLELLVQPAHRAALSCQRRRHASHTRCARGSRKAARSALSTPRQRRLDHLSRLASCRHHRIRLRGARSAPSRHHLRRGPNGSLALRSVTGQVQNVTPLPDAQEGISRRSHRADPVLAG